jgi:anti-anti-sigma regulatory factor
MIVQKEEVAVKETKAVILHISGIIKLGESGDFLFKAMKGLNDSSAIILDFAQANHTDSTGIGELVAICIKFAEENCKKLAFVNATTRVVGLLRIANSLELIHVFADKEKAVASFAAAA